MTDLPGPLRPAPTPPFVGRASELGTLHTMLPRAEGEGGRVALVAGEPGSGKSRLVREFAASAASDGALVLYGACDPMVRAPYGPVVEALDQLLRAVDADELRPALGARGGELTRLLPQLRSQVGDLPKPVAADPDTERHRLHTAVTDLLVAVGRLQPVVLMLEDGHWADMPTLLLLRHLTRAGGQARLLLVATFRDTEADMPDALSDTLADLRRADEVVRLRLAGLSVDEVVDFVERATGCQPDGQLRELGAGIHELTAGNAFLVCELWRTLVETGTVEVDGGRVGVTRPLGALASPESVREVTSQRLSRLAARTIDLLELAATAGSEFDLALVRRAAGLSEAELAAGLDEGSASGMVEEVPGTGLAWRFTHELVRRALYDRLSRLRRSELHLRVGEALEAAGPESGRGIADLAHHFAAAAPFGGAARAVEYNRRAARAAADALAFDEAALRLRTVLELGVDDPAERGRTYLELGRVSNKNGKTPDALEAFAAAARIARELASAELLARSAIGYEDACWRPGIVSPEAVELLEEALTALGHEQPELRVGLLGGLARALDFQGERERGSLVRANAVELARRLDDRVGLASVLVRSYWSRGTSPLEEILAMLTEARDLAEELGSSELRVEAMAWRVPTFVAMSDMDSARREVASVREMAARTAQPFMHHVAEHYGSAIALCDGRLDDAEAMAVRSHEWGRLLAGRDASGTYGIQMFSIRREQGRLPEIAPAIRILAREASRDGPWRPGLVAVLAELGMEAEARRELGELAADGIDAFRPSLWLATLSYLADACALLGDERMAAILYPELEPFAGANVMIGHLVSCYGAADRYLGTLAAILGEPGRAEEHFTQAMALNRRMGAQTWLAHSAYEYARLLVGRGREGRERAQALIGEAAGLAERIGMRALLGRIHALGVPAGDGDLPAGLSPREAQILGLVSRGLSNREIGETLSISEHTAANHIRSILRKTDSANRTEATSFAHRHGLATP